MYVFLCYFLCLLQFRKNSEFGADERTQSAFHAVFGLKHNLGRVISFVIEQFAFFKTAVGAELYAEAASFATIPNDIHFSMRYGMGLSVERQAPEFHNTTPCPENPVVYQYSFFFKGVNSLG